MRGDKFMNPVVHFEMPAEDRKRMADFYTKVFGWKTQMMGPEMGNYVVVTTAESDEKTRRPKQPGSINGGFYEKDKSKTDQYPSIVIAVDDIWAAMKAVTAAGGKVLGGQKPGEPDDIPGVGLYAGFIDTEGNRVGILQPSGDM
jgi:predicted enzyme related to lactoylglutathione lyase